MATAESEDADEPDTAGSSAGPPASPDDVLTNVPGANPVSATFGEIVFDGDVGREELLQLRSGDAEEVFTFYQLGDDERVYFLIVDDREGTYYYELDRDTAVQLVEEVSSREKWSIHPTEIAFERLFPV
jgi:hypothetical protein